MSFRFSLAALTAVVTLTSCAKPQTANEQPDSYFKGPSQINVTHVMTRADDGSDIFLTIDGNDAGPLIAGQTVEVRVPAGKHQVGGYAATMLGLGRVTIEPLEVTTRKGEETQIAYSVTRQKPVFAKEGVSKLPPPAPAQPAATSTDASQSAAATTTQPPAATSTDASQSAASTTTQPPAATSTDASQSAASTTTQPPAATSTNASQNAASTTTQPPAATSTNTSQSAASTTAQPPAATSTNTSQHTGG